MPQITPHPNPLLEERGKEEQKKKIPEQSGIFF